MSLGKVVGDLGNPNRRTHRAPVNPMDKATVISIYPLEIRDTKPTIFPGNFVIPAGNVNKPGILVVGPSSWWKELDAEQPLLEIPISSVVVADSIVRDYVNSVIETSSDARIGLVFIPGEHNLESIKKNYPNLLKEMETRQNAWFSKLVRLADSLWARANGNPRAISDDMRMAAKLLNLSEKDWMKEFKHVDMVKCIACGNLRNPDYPICSVCKAVVDPEKAKELKLTFVA